MYLLHKGNSSLQVCDEYDYNDPSSSFSHPSGSEKNRQEAIILPSPWGTTHTVVIMHSSHGEYYQYLQFSLHQVLFKHYKEFSE